MTGKDPKVSVFARNRDLVNFHVGNLAVRGDNLQLDVCRKHISHNDSTRSPLNREFPHCGLLRLQPLSLFKRLLECPNHIEGLLRDVVVLALNNRLEPADGIFQLDVSTLEAGELLRHKERLREEALDLTGARHGQLVFFGKFVHAEDSDDVLEVLVLLKNRFHRTGNVVMLLAQDSGIENP